MLRKTKTLLLSALVFSIALISFPLAAKSVENDFGLWTAININAPITDKVQSRFQISPRWLDDVTDFNQFILHGLLGYKFNKYVSFYQGYAWSTLYIPNFRREQRPYQELLFFHNIDKLSFEHRFRLDERFMQDVDGVSMRARYRIKGSYPLGMSKKWSLIMFDELFVILNSKDDGPQAGIDQNRTYIGINRKLNENMNIDLGYQLQQIHRPGSLYERLNHFVFFYLNFDLPKLVSNKN